MALTQGQLKFIITLGELSKILLEAYPDGVLTNVQWNGTPNFDTTITQPDIDAEPRLAEIGLEYADIQEMAYVVSNMQNELGSRVQHAAKLKELA
ncbi:MAG: hypothetical protein K8L91_01570 [Anaerolineae bacterium]|nr:hypothetical protein [Anaerolineae bacterium]